MAKKENRVMVTMACTECRRLSSAQLKGVVGYRLPAVDNGGEMHCVLGNSWNAESDGD